MLAPQTARQASGRGVVLLPAAALLVHQLRYWLTYGSSASSQLADQGHAYLGAAVPWLVIVTAAGLAAFVTRLARSADSPRRRFGSVWGTTSAGLLAIYVLQELLEGLFATGHPGGLAGVFGHGGWWSVPAAVAVAFVMACLLRVTETLVRLVARRRPARVRTTSAVLRPRAGTRPRLSPLASAAAGRAPPLLA